MKKNIVKAKIGMKVGSKGSSEWVRNLRKSVKGLEFNALNNAFIFYDKSFENPIELDEERIYKILNSEFPATLYAKVKDAPIKIEICIVENDSDYITVQPLKPYVMKNGYGSEQKTIDMGFYIERLIELCENFAIYELKTEIPTTDT